MNSYPLLKMFACAVALMALAVVLVGCNGYPRYEPKACSTLEVGDATGLWVCE